jgi:hypothetical protein
MAIFASAVSDTRAVHVVNVLEHMRQQPIKSIEQGITIMG